MADHDPPTLPLESMATVPDPSKPEELLPTVAGSQTPGVPAKIGGTANTLTQIGQYRILREIGQGGMGRVFLAEQEPTDQRVAIKLMNVSLASPRAVARFSAERRAMARLSHPNIARIFDAGTTEDGYPFFVMEYVPGDSITDYADLKALSIEDRLRLFLQVCAGVQHAHLNQILHRDLKPSNIMVTEVDGEPTVKIIDFGIAKALDGPLGDEPLMTGTKVVGTPAYLSPEAVGLDPNLTAVDIRTDVYSSGMVLYFLLTGVLPFELEGTVFNLLKRIVQDEPTPPSRRFEHMGKNRRETEIDAPEIIARHRQLQPSDLTRRLQGDLDWMTLQAIAKHPDQRYHSAAEFASDIQRHLDFEPVNAGPQTLGYRFRKWIRRNRFEAAAACVTLLALVASVVGTTVGMVQAREAEARAEAKAIEANEARLEAEEASAFLLSIWNASQKQKGDSDDPKADENLEGVLLRRVPTDARGSLRETLHLARNALGHEHPNLVPLLISLTRYHRTEGQYVEGEALLRQTVNIFENHLNADHRALAIPLNRLGTMLWEQGRFVEAKPYFQRAYDLKLAAYGPASVEIAAPLNNLGLVAWKEGQWAEAREALERAFDLWKSRGPENKNVAWALWGLAGEHRDQGHFEEAEGFYRQALTNRENQVKIQDKLWQDIVRDYAALLRQLDRHDEAIALEARLVH